MRLAVHDFSGHPFQVQLSRELAHRGHEVLHLHCPSYISGKGALGLRDRDPPQLAIDGVSLGRPFEKYSPLRRYQDEREYGRLAVRRLRAYQPEAVLSSNTPLFAQDRILRWCRGANVPFVFWQQDIYSLGMKSAVKALPLLRNSLGRLATTLEARLLRRSDQIVVISEDFLPTLRQWGVPDHRVQVVHNWAPLAELPMSPRGNAWSREHGLHDKLVFLYSGTLGRKHNPDVLLQLADRFRDREDVVIVIASEGEVTDALRERVAAAGLANVKFVGFQEYDRLPEVLGSADILLLILEKDAGVFSVPSKLLSYQCAGRPILASVPPENLASRLITSSRSGLVALPSEPSHYCDQAVLLADDGDLRQHFGNNARAHAERTFDIERIGSCFEEVFFAAVGRSVPHL